MDNITKDENLRLVAELFEDSRIHKVAHGHNKKDSVDSNHAILPYLQRIFISSNA
jgi:hypothetical protein